MAGGCWPAGGLVPGWLGKLSGIVLGVPPSGVTVTDGVPVGLAGDVLAAGAFCRSRTLPEAVAFRVARIASVSEVTMNTAAAMVVAFERTVAEPRGPKAVCDPIPPNAPAKSAALPLCSSTTTTKKKQTIT